MKGLLASIRGARPSFLDGVASIFDFGDTLADPYYAPAFESDDEAFAHDWCVLGADARTAVAEHAAPVSARLDRSVGVVGHVGVINAQGGRVVVVGRNIETITIDDPESKPISELKPDPKPDQRPDE